MFKFFKEKLKSWIGKSKEDIESKPVEIEEKVEEEKEAKVQEKLRLKEEKQKQKEQKKLEKLKRKEESLLRKKPREEEKEKPLEELQIEEPVEIEALRTAPELEELEKEKKPGIFRRIKERFSYKISEEDFDEIFENLEMLLLENNVALEAVEAIKKQLKTELVNKEIKKEDLEQEIKRALKKVIENLLIEPDDVLTLVKMKQPFVFVFFGVNGVGKTTAIAKIANLLLKNNVSCVIAAADTFRAASIEQLEEHASNLGIKLIKHEYGADPAAVAFDAIKYAKSHNIQVVLIDTAGRMHTHSNLLSEMEKICRVTNPDMKIFVAESIAGNDAVQQAKSFNEIVGIDGCILTKADVDEKGGTAISISYVTKRPILFLGTGQEYDQLEVFNREKFMSELGL